MKWSSCCSDLGRHRGVVVEQPDVLGPSADGLTHHHVVPGGKADFGVQPDQLHLVRQTVAQGAHVVGTRAVVEHHHACVAQARHGSQQRAQALERGLRVVPVQDADDDTDPQRRGRIEVAGRSHEPGRG
jgi:hypothetical protein